jgi:yecA family protein
MRSRGVRAGAMNVIPNSPLSNEEIRELDAFLMSDATPDECMDVVTLDGFLSALAIGPELVPPSVWLPLVVARRNLSSSLRHKPSALSAY